MLIIAVRGLLIIHDVLHNQVIMKVIVTTKRVPCHAKIYISHFSIKLAFHILSTIICRIQHAILWLSNASLHPAVFALY